MNLILGGGTGLIGRALTAAFQSAGHNVRIVTRNPKSKSEISWTEVRSCGLPENTDVVINLSGRSIGEINPLYWFSGPFDEYWKDVFASRIDTTKSLVKACMKLKLKFFINASAVGFYRPDIRTTFTESEPFCDCGPITRLVRDWEAAAQIPNRKDVRQFQLRLGVVLAKDSNFIKSLYPSHRVGLGGALGSGQQWISWVHLDDVVRVVQFLIQPDCPVVSGPVNVTTPHAVRQAALSRCLSEAIGAPCLPFGAPPTPSFVPRLLLGPYRATLVLDGQRVIPQKLLDAGFQFKYALLEDALHAIYGRRPSPPAYD
ncbi:Sugar nucleotide epimerase [Fasciola gigantica]|uniref:Sugar nucleotide epimerase n=1 Tax=Fasciola gigantica TaxID=46835 RepID=A0A504Z1L8_FASGI|nr:Sugar nucleotide epimerase [Fasciola gigantica]